MPFIEKKAGLKFERIGAPQPAEMARAAADAAVAAVSGVDESVVPWFRAAAQRLLEGGADPVDVLAKAIAKITGAQQHLSPLKCQFIHRP